MTRRKLKWADISWFIAEQTIVLIYVLEHLTEVGVLNLEWYSPDSINDITELQGTLERKIRAIGSIVCYIDARSDHRMLVTIDAFTTIIHDTRRVIYIHERTPKFSGLSVSLKPKY